VIDLREVVPPNASPAIDMTLLGIVTEARSRAFPKVPFSIDVMLLGITMEVSALSENALDPM
jgi:hypothetical protein